MPIEKVLLVEDDAVLRKSLESQLKQARYDVAVAPTIAAAQSALANDSFDVVITDVQLPDGDGTQFLQLFQNRASRPLVVIISGHGSVEAAMACMKQGAFDYLLKPFTPEQLEVSLRRASDYSQLLKVNRFLTEVEPDDLPSELIGDSPAMQELRGLIRRVGPTDATVLIQGESGTGKELVARELFRQSSRRGAPYIRVNCAAIPENLIESEFFGHERGAFTGAIGRREGRFVLADTGTILLDEVSEVSLSIQAKLLRVLQEKELERVGGNKTVSIDVRVIATTNRNLEESIAKKEFREDLFFRLNVVPMYVAPLRERAQDIPQLAKVFVDRASRKLGTHVPQLGPDCQDALLSHTWPGNVRELDNVLQRAVILSGGADTLTADHLRLGKPRASSVEAPSGPVLQERSKDFVWAPTSDLPTLDQVEKDLIFAALKKCQNNRTHAAKVIGISLRTLRNKLSEYRSAGYREAMLTRDLDDTLTEAA
ncbi:MAG: sigma-54-dependent Fis family transcriptional regulator [Verrucomicrobia bacterium]|nr:sigma-54-dependent Fis family transcriptional regulator [Verrucomicrobiota bacterium]MBI3868801.1 sigma-54-dependent Fis family transcriptional regulator [Verrucomicrobiota bacterium]